MNSTSWGSRGGADDPTQIANQPQRRSRGLGIELYVVEVAKIGDVEHGTTR